MNAAQFFLLCLDKFRFLILDYGCEDVSVADVGWGYIVQFQSSAVCLKIKLEHRDQYLTLTISPKHRRGNLLHRLLGVLRVDTDTIDIKTIVRLRVPELINWETTVPRGDVAKTLEFFGLMVTTHAQDLLNGDFHQFCASER